MNKRFGIGIVLLGVILAMGCSKTKYQDFIEVNTQFINAMDEYTQDLNKADNAKAVAAAFEKFADRMEKIAPQMKALRGKYPEWQDQSKIPDELKPLSEKAQEVTRRIPESFMKVMPYMNDPKVMEAMQKVQQAMMMMN